LQIRRGLKKIWRCGAGQGALDVLEKDEVMLKRINLDQLGPLRQGPLPLHKNPPLGRVEAPILGENPGKGRKKPDVSTRMRGAMQL